MENELKDALSQLKTDMEGKNKAETKSLVDAFELKFNDAIAEVKNSNESNMTEVKDSLKAIQDHVDKLDVKLEAKASQENAPKDGLKALIQDNFDEIKTVRKGKSVAVETKTVANMTLATALTGDQPRTFSNDVVMLPGQKLNVADIAGSISISGGTYTYPVEGPNEGTITTQTEGSDKAQVDFDITMTDLNTDFIAGFCVYSKKMANNLPFLESYLPDALRRDYWKNENRLFSAVLASAATASSEVITSNNKIQMLIGEIAALEGANYSPNYVVVTPADYWDIMITEKSTGAGYGLPGAVTLDAGGQLRINGIPILRANWVLTNKYFVGDFSRVKRVTTMGLAVEFSEHDEDNFRKNNISARVEAQVGLAVEQTAAIIYGDFTAT
jgi:HK97 family phage major capsid protein